MAKNNSTDETTTDIEAPDKFYDVAIGEKLSVSLGSVPVKDINYEINKPDIALVDAYGNIYPIKEGHARLTMTYGRKKYKTKINVDESAKGAAFEELYLSDGKSAKIPKLDDEETNIISSSITTLSIVKNKVKAIGSGKATVKVSTSANATYFNVYSRPKKIECEDIEIGVGETYKLPISRQLYRTPKYKVSKKKVLKISSTGVLEGLSAGKTKVTVSDRGTILKFNVTVTGDPHQATERELCYDWDVQRQTPDTTLYFNKVGQYVNSKEAAEQSVQDYLSKSRSVTPVVSGNFASQSGNMKVGDTFSVEIPNDARIYVNGTPYNCGKVDFKVTYIGPNAKLEIQDNKVKCSDMKLDFEYSSVGEAFIWEGYAITGLTDYGKSLPLIVIPNYTDYIATDALSGNTKATLWLETGLSSTILPPQYKLLEGQYYTIPGA